MFRMLDPTKLPMLRSLFPLMAAVNEAAISGTLVPNATTVTPTAWLLIPMLSATSAAPRTNASEPKNNPTHPMTSIATSIG